MNPSPLVELAHASRSEDLRRDALRSAARRRRAPVAAEALVIRAAGPRDRKAVERLAALDEREPLAGEVLLAEVGGVPLAALAVASGASVADPFAATDDLVRMLRLRAEQLRPRGGSLVARAASSLAPAVRPRTVRRPA